MATIIGKLYSVCQTLTEVSSLYWTFDIDNIPSLYIARIGEIDGCATFQHKRFRQQRTVMEIVEYLHQSHHLFEVVANKALLLGDDVKSLSTKPRQENALR